MCWDTERSQSHKTEKNKEKHCNLFDPDDPVEIWEYEKATFPNFITLDENSSDNSTKMMRVQ